jgi:hypothetical protein
MSGSFPLALDDCSLSDDSGLLERRDAFAVEIPRREQLAGVAFALP